MITRTPADFQDARLRGRLYLALAAGLSALWCATLARLLVELWPRWLIVLGSPLALLACGALGAALGWGVFRPAARPEIAWPLALSALYLFQPAVAPAWGIVALLAGVGGAIWLATGARTEGPEWPWGLFAFVAPLALFVATCAPSVLPGDSAEFQFVAPMLGIPHPTGYPLYLLLGRLFTLLPVGSVAYRLNLFSAVAAAGAVWAIYRAARAIDLSRTAALIGAALLAVSETLWSQATIAEKYALNAFFVALTLWLGLEWRKRRSNGWLQAWAVCCGLSLTHHRTMIVLAPACLLLVWLTDRTVLRPKSVLRLLPFFLIPLSFYLLLPLFSSFNPPYAYVRIDSIKAFFDLVFARTYQSGLFRGGWAALPGRAAEFASLLWRQFGPLGLLLALGGWIALLFKRRAVAWTLLGGIAAEVFFALNYYVPNTHVYYLPAYVWLAFCAAAAAEAGIDWLREAFKNRAGQSLRLLWALSVAALPLALGISRFEGQDQRRAYAGLSFDYTYGQVALRAVGENALIVGDWLPATVLWYTQWVEGLAPTAQIVAVDSLELQWPGYAEQGLHEGRPVYLARPVMAASGQYALESAGPLVQVLEMPFEVWDGRCYSPPETRTSIWLCGFDLEATLPGAEGRIDPLKDAQTVQGGSTLHLTIYWQAQEVPGGDDAVTVRLIDPAGHVRLEKQNRHPVGGTYPTSRWQAFDVVPDYYRLTLPASLPSGQYELQVELGQPFQEGDRFNVTRLQVIKPLRWPYTTPSTLLHRSMGDLVLLGHDAARFGAAREAAVGETVTLSLLWLVRHAPGEFPQLVWIDKSGADRIIPAGYDTLADWQPGALIVQQYTFKVMDALAYEVRAGDQVLRLPLRAVKAPPPLANFGNLVRLRSYQYESDALKAGETVRLTLNWEAAAQIGEPYKVFVHVLGPNGLPVAQQDNEPLNGTFPTTRWARGERVADPYAFALPADLPPGEYQVEVGLYRLSDFGRLPLLDAGQNVIDDKVFLSPIRVVEP